MARYRKIDLRIWTDAGFNRLTPMQPSGRALWFYLLTCPETGIIPGVIVGYPEGMAARLAWSADAFLKAFGEASREAMAEADWKAGLIWIPKAIKHNPPQSPNVIKSWSGAWDEVPECQLKNKAWSQLKAFTEGMGKSFGDAFREALPKPSGKAWANQEQEQEQEQDSGNRDLAPPDGVAPSLLQVQEQQAQEPKPKPKKQPKPKAPKPVKLEPDPEPMPFTIREMLAALDGATPKLLVKPYDPAYSKPLTAAIRSAGALGYGMDDIRLAAEYCKAGGLNWAAEPLQVNWLAKGGSLTTLLGRVRAWRDRGKPPFVQQGGSQGGSGGSSGPGYKSPETLMAEESSRRVQQMAKEAEERRKNLTPEEEAEEARAAASIRNGGWMQIGRAAREAEALAAAGGEDHETAEAEESEEL